MQVSDEQIASLKAAYEKVALWPETRMKPNAVLELGQGFTDLLELRNIVEQLLSALAASPAEPVAWQPMETAPMDGTHFLAAHHMSKAIRISWHGKTSHVPLYGWCHGDDAEDIDLWSPTHWQPLPAPPALVQS